MHVTCSCIFHAYIYFLFLSILCFCVVIVFSLSLYLSRIDCTMHPKRVNPLRLKILLVSSLLLLILSLLSTFDSMMRRLERTSWRTFRNVAFIRSAMLFRQAFPTLLSLSSFGLEARNLYLRVPWGIPSYLYRSFTPIYMVSILLYLDLPLHFEVHVS